MVHHRSNRSMWFGTFEKMGWIPTPQTGADSTADDWSSSGTLLNGGGYVNHSWGSNKVFDYSWGKSAARETAQLMKSYRDGAYGRGLLYFHSPLAYSINVLPARWANPAMATQDEGFSHVYNVQPKAMPVTGHEKNGYPVEAAQFSMPIGVGGYDERSSLFIPIPPGMTLHLGAVYEYTGTAGVFYRPVSSAGVVGDSVRIDPVEITDTTIAPTEVTGGRGVYLWFGKTGAAAETLTVTAVTARLATTDERTWTNYAANGSAASGSSVGWAGVSGIDSVGGAPMFVSSEVVTPPPVTVPGDASYAAFHASVASPSAGTVTVELRGLTEDVQLSTSHKSVVMETTVNPGESFAPTFTPSDTVGVTDYRVGFGSSPQQARVAAAAAFDYSTEDSAKFVYRTEQSVEVARNLLPRPNSTTLWGTGALKGDLERGVPISEVSGTPYEDIIWLKYTSAPDDPATLSVYPGVHGSGISASVVPGETYYCRVLVYASLQSGSTSIRMVGFDGATITTNDVISTVPTSLGVSEFSWLWTCPEGVNHAAPLVSFIRTDTSADQTFGWAEPVISTTPTTWFAGSSPQVGNMSFEWAGDENYSASIAYYTPVTRTPIPEESRGPWHGGQGHSGCRFDGQPTYVEYTGVNGGQVGFSATFREVGDSVGAFY